MTPPGKFPPATQFATAATYLEIAEANDCASAWSAVVLAEAASLKYFAIVFSAALRSPPFAFFAALLNALASFFAFASPPTAVGFDDGV